jgi:hypothetical protein
LDLPEDFEDEEIDEDTAFTEEDYLRYGDSTVSKKRPSHRNAKYPVKPSGASDDEGEESPDDFEGDSGDDGEFVMLADLLQGLPSHVSPASSVLL